MTDAVLLTDEVLVTVFSRTRPAPSRTTRVLVEISRPLCLIGFETLVVRTGTGGGPGLLLEEEAAPASFDFRDGIGFVLAVTDVVLGLVLGLIPLGGWVGTLHGFEEVGGDLTRGGVSW